MNLQLQQYDQACWNRIRFTVFPHMLMFKDSRDTDVPIFICLMAFATPVAIAAYSIYWLLQPLVISGPDGSALTGNSPARTSFMFQFVKDDGTSIAMAHAAEKSADEANLAFRADGARTAEGVRQSDNRTAAKAQMKPTRRPQRIAHGPPLFSEGFGARAEARSFRWNYETRNRYVGRWF
jgi:hypothetical protein